MIGCRDDGRGDCGVKGVVEVSRDRLEGLRVCKGKKKKGGGGGREGE